MPKSPLRMRACTPFTTSTTWEMSKSVAALQVGVARAAGPSRSGPGAGRSRRARSSARRRRGPRPCRSAPGTRTSPPAARPAPRTRRTASSRGTTSKPHRRPQRRLHRGQRHLAVALREVRVADVRQRARRPAPAGRASSPTVSRLMSMLPPCGPGGTECGRASPATATPMIPRNGVERERDQLVSAGPQRQRADARARRSSTLGEDAEHVAVAAGTPRAAHPCRAGWRSRRTAPAAGVSSTVIASRSPASAPRTSIGPVDRRAARRRRTCAACSPTPRSRSRRRAPRPRRTPRRTPCGSRPWSSRMPSWLTVSNVTSAPGSTVRSPGRRPRTAAGPTARGRGRGQVGGARRDVVAGLEDHRRQRSHARFPPCDISAWPEPP